MTAWLPLTRAPNPEPWLPPSPAVAFLLFTLFLQNPLEEVKTVDVAALVCGLDGVGGTRFEELCEE